MTETNENGNVENVTDSVTNLNDYVRDNILNKRVFLKDGIGKFDADNIHSADDPFSRNWLLRSPSFKEFVYPLMRACTIESFEGGRTRHPYNPLQKPVNMDKLMETLKDNDIPISITDANILMPGSEYNGYNPKVSEKSLKKAIKELRKEGYDFEPIIDRFDKLPMYVSKNVAYVEWNKIPENLDDPKLMKRYQVASSVFPEGNSWDRIKSIDWITGEEVYESNLKIFQNYEKDSGKVVFYFDFNPSPLDWHNITHHLIPVKVIQLMNDCMIKEKGDEK